MASGIHRGGLENPRKLRLSREVSYILGLFTMPFAIAISTKADLGLSMIAAPAFIISEKVSGLTYGQTEYIVQTLVLSVMCIVVRKFKLSYLFSFITSILYGTILDIFLYILKDFEPEKMLVRVILFILGMIITSISVTFFFNTYIPPCSYDFFVRDVVFEKKADMRKFKMGFDAAFLIISLLLTLLLFRGFIGISIGTVIIVLVNGNIISAFDQFLKKHVEFYDRFPLARYF